MGAAEFYRAVPNSDVDVQTINQLAKFLARFEEGNSLRGHFDSGSGFWIASDARSSLARVEASESADFNLIASSQGTDDAVKYGANDDVGLVPGKDTQGVLTIHRFRSPAEWSSNPPMPHLTGHASVSTGRPHDVPLRATHPLTELEDAAKCSQNATKCCEMQPFAHASLRRRSKS